MKVKIVSIFLLSDQAMTTSDVIFVPWHIWTVAAEGDLSGVV